MRRTSKKFLCALLSAAMFLGTGVTPVYAEPVHNVEEVEPEQTVETEKVTETETEETVPEETEPVEEKTVEEEAEGAAPVKAGKNFFNRPYKVDLSKIDFSKRDIHSYVANATMLDDDTEIDTEDPTIVAVEEELSDMKVLNEEGNLVPLTEEQKQQVLYMFSQYLSYWKEHEDVLGVQLPFFLAQNDTKDNLGILGEMLALAGIPLDAVRAGAVKFDDLTGMIMNFSYGDQLGVQYYASALRAKRDEFFKVLDKSGAKTEVQKLLILNDWLAGQASFDMSYIMNAGKDEPVMVAENPQEHPHRQDVYNVIYQVYEKQIGDTFRGQFKEGIEADMRQKYYEAAIPNVIMQGSIRNIIFEQAKAQGADEEAANTAADAYMQEHANEINAVGPLAYVEKNFGEEAAAQVKAGADGFMAENEEAIKTDAAGFVAAAFPEEVSAQLAAGADAFIEEARTTGVEVDPVNAPGYKITVDQLVEQQMETNKDIPDLQGMTPNQAIPVFADQAAQGITDGVLNYWEGNQFGALAEGKAVCLGYAKAYSWLMQCMHPEIYGKNGAGTDMKNASNWKTPKELYYDDNGDIDINKDYNTDLVRITYHAQVTMYGEVQPDFNSDHFWNAVKIDGKWYYVDPCYTDVFSEVMVRDRAEMDGYINHLYFMFSHTAAAELYDGYFSEIKSLYTDVATNRDYEKSWVSRIKSDTLSDGKNFYYVYDSMDMIQLNNDANSNQNQDFEEMMKDTELKLVRHAITDKDAGNNGDSDYEALIEFNHKANEDDDTTVARVLNKDGVMEENKLLTDLFAKFDAERDVYPSINITAALYNNKLYFNLSNYILAYDLSTCEVKVVKEYTTVYGTRDKTEAFGGSAFSMNETSGDFEVKGHPIAAMSLKEDGTLRVAIATNFAYISGKDAHNSEDQGSYGYEFEESNYNPKYNDYGQDSQYDVEQFGYTKEKNDNDEFMWVANFVGTESMGTLEGSEVEIGEDFEVPVCDHHFVKFEEEYYTKDKNSGAWNTGHCYVCPECGYAIDEPVKPKDNAQQEVKDEYEKQKALYDEAAAKAGHKYVPTDAKWSEDSTTVSFTKMECSSVCLDRKDTLDCLLEDETVALSNLNVTAEAAVTGHEGDCTSGTTVIYTAEGEVDGHKFTAENKVTKPAGQHSYEAEFTWTEVADEEGNVTGYTAAATVTCGVCGDTHENVEAVVALDEKNSVAPTCEEAGKNVYVATATVKDESGNTIGTATDMKEVEVPAAGHHYGEDGKCEVCGKEKPVIEAPVIESVFSRLQTTVKVTWNKVENAYGYQLYRADSINAAEDEWNLTKTIKGDDVEKYTKDGSLQYTNVDLTVGKTYYYKVRAFELKEGATDANDENARIYSDFSAVDYMPSAVVFDNVYSNSTSRIRILWNKVDSSHGYQIWRMNDDGTYSIVKTLGDKNNILTDDQGATTAYSNTGLEAGKTYTYKMRAFTIFEGEKKVFGAYSDEIKVAVMPKAPTLTASNTKAGRADLTWNAVDGAAGYQVWMAGADGKYSIVKSITDGTAKSYTKYDLKGGTTYSFKLRAYTEVNGKKTFGEYTNEVSVQVK